MPPPPPPFRISKRPPNASSGAAPSPPQLPPPPPPPPPFARHQQQQQNTGSTSGTHISSSTRSTSSSSGGNGGAVMSNDSDRKRDSHRSGATRTTTSSNSIRGEGSSTREHGYREKRRRTRSYSSSSSSSSYSYSDSYSYSSYSDRRSASSRSRSDTDDDDNKNDNDGKDKRSANKSRAKARERQHHSVRNSSNSRSSSYTQNSSGRGGDAERDRRDHRRHRDRSPSYARYRKTPRATNESRISSSAAAQSSGPLLPLPPRRTLTVPSDLPLSFTVLADYVAFHVAVGGPAVEEEIRWRERSNLAFRFMTDSWDSPHALYYRWRLYSLLQGDTMLAWRATPFQMEEGAQNYWWVPPPPLVYGADALRVVQESVRNGEKEKCDLSTSHSVPECAAWLAAQSLSEGKLFDFLPQPNCDQWKRMMDYASLLFLPPLTGGKEDDDCEKKDRLESEVPPPSLEEYAGTVSRVVLSADFVAERMTFLIDLQQRGVLHALSLVVDELLRRLAELLDACSKKKERNSDDSHEATRTAVRCCFSALSTLFILHDVVRNNNATPLTTKEAAREAMEDDQNNNGGGGGNNVESADKSTLNRGRIGAWASRNVQNKSVRGAAQFSSSSSSKRAGGSAQQQQQKNTALGRDFDKVLPVLTECVLAIAMTAIHEFGDVSFTTATSPAMSSAPVEKKERENEEEDRGRRVLESIQKLRVTAASPLDAAQTAYHHVCAALPATISVNEDDERIVAVRIALLLISWLHTLCNTWTDSDAVGTRCETTLLSTHGFFFSRAVELTTPARTSAAVV